MSAKIQIKSDLVGTYGGIFLMLDHFGKANLDKLINKSLGDRRFNAKYFYSDIFKTLLATYATNGSCIEDSKRVSDQISENSQGYRLCSPDVILNSFKEISTKPTSSRSESGIEYKFNYNPALTDLSVKGLVQCGQVDTKAAHVFDYDNQFIPTEKHDAKFSYKKAFGYFPGIAQVDGYPFFVENRDGNANVKYLSFTDVAESRHSKRTCYALDFCNIQAETLEKAYLALEENGIKVGSSRMDCGSYSKEIVETVARHSRTFFIRAGRCETLRKRIDEIDDSAWEDVEINYIKCQLTSIPFTAFLEEEGYRLVVQRTLRDQPDLFDGEYDYRCILTNDTEMSNKDVVLFYNMRGGTERCFDCMNNDFGCLRPKGGNIFQNEATCRAPSWKRTPCSWASWSSSTTSTDTSSPSLRAKVSALRRPRE